MSLLPAFTPLFDRLLDFAIRPEHEAELVRARQDYFSRTGEVFDEDRSFDVRMQAFLDWYVFDRPLAPTGEPPSRAFLATLADAAERDRFRLLGRTVHGVFEVRKNSKKELAVHNLLTAADYTVPMPGPLAGVQKLDLFEGRLVPFEGRHHFSSAFLFHPPMIKRSLLRELKRQHRHETGVPVQEIIWTLSRMATRAEHYRNVAIDSIYDFGRPPPKVSAAPMRFDAASVEARRQRLTGIIRGAGAR
jgi:hypothetical protein